MNTFHESFLTWLSRRGYAEATTGRYLHVAIDIRGEVEDLIGG